MDLERADSDGDGRGSGVAGRACDSLEESWVVDGGEPGRRRHGSVSCSSQYYGIARADVSGAGQDPGVRAADVLHENWETIQSVTYYDSSRIHIALVLEDCTRRLRLIGHE